MEIKVRSLLRIICELFVLAGLITIPCAVRAGVCREILQKPAAKSVAKATGRAAEELLEKASIKKEGYGLLKDIPSGFTQAQVHILFEYLKTLDNAGDLNIIFKDGTIAYSFRKRGQEISRPVEHELLNQLSNFLKAVIERVYEETEGESFRPAYASLRWNVEGINRVEAGGPPVRKHVDGWYLTAVMSLLGDGTILFIDLPVSDGVSGPTGAPVLITGRERARKTGIRGTWHNAPGGKSERLLLQIMFD
jgi:hypothetical protein